MHPTPAPLSKAPNNLPVLDGEDFIKSHYAKWPVLYLKVWDKVTGQRFRLTKCVKDGELLAQDQEVRAEVEMK